MAGIIPIRALLFDQACHLNRRPEIRLLAHLLRAAFQRLREPLPVTELGLMP